MNKAIAIVRTGNRRSIRMDFTAEQFCRLCDALSIPPDCAYAERLAMSAEFVAAKLTECSKAYRQLQRTHRCEEGK